MKVSPKNDKPLNFLNFATRNYISSRVLYLKGQTYDAGIMAHEALEKIMKSLIYYLDNTKSYDKIHDLNGLRNILIRDYKYDTLKKEKELFKYYEECYSYRYPENKKPQSFNTGTNKIHLLDMVFHYFHEECIKQIKDEEIKYACGIYLQSFNYYESNEVEDVEKLTLSNETFDIEYIDIGKKYWHDKDIFVKNENGSYRDPFGNRYASK